MLRPFHILLLTHAQIILVFQFFFAETSTSEVTSIYSMPANNSCDSYHRKLTAPTINGAYCRPKFDGITCWPPTPSGTVATISCFHELNGVQYDSSQNASRLCYGNGTWESNSNYSSCTPIQDAHQTLWDAWDVNDSTLLIYYIGYTLSLVFLLIALAIFLSFKDLQCLRNIFHIHLMLTYVLVIITWIAAASSNPTSPVGSQSTCIMVIFLYYFKGTNFFWMFVEGLYLYTLVVRTFSCQKLKFYVYCLIGWGIPAVVVGIWAAVKAKFTDSEHSATSPDQIDRIKGCPWLVDHTLDWIFVCPILLVLFINVIFLVQIMSVLITKLRALQNQNQNLQNAAESPESQQYRKAAKALLVLIPLFGVTYIIVIAPPPTGLGRVIYAYIRSILLSTQGLFVSVLYCFLNGDVKTTIRKHWDRRRQRSSSSRCWKFSDSLKTRSSQEEMGSLRHSESRPGNKGKRYSPNNTFTSSNNTVNTTRLAL